MVNGITLIILSIIAVPSLLLSKRPDAKEMLAKVEPYQGWIGLVFCLWGLWGIIQSILWVGYLADFPIWWISFLAINIVQFSLGFMLGYGLINKYALSKNETAREKGEQLRAKIAPLQGKIGILGIILGIWMIVADILFH